jgi:hypothetical protein
MFVLTFATQCEIVVGTLPYVCFSAPRLDPRLVTAIVRLDDTSVPIAETYRRSREVAADLAFPARAINRIES